MKIIHIVPHIVEEASGPSYSVPRLCQSEAREGHDVELTCLANRSGLDGVTLDVHPQWPDRAQRGSFDRALHQARRHDRRRAVRRDRSAGTHLRDGRQPQRLRGLPLPPQ